LSGACSAGQGLGHKKGGGNSLIGRKGALRSPSGGGTRPRLVSGENDTEKMARVGRTCCKLKKWMPGTAIPARCRMHVKGKFRNHPINRSPRGETTIDRQEKGRSKVGEKGRSVNRRRSGGRERKVRLAQGMDQAPRVRRNLNARTRCKEDKRKRSPGRDVQKKRDARARRGGKE